MRHHLYVHIVWATRDRAPLIDALTADFLCRYLPAIACQEHAEVLAIGVVRTHVHLLVRLHPTTSIPRLLQRLKGGSSLAAAKEHGEKPTLRWAKAYAIHSVSPRSLAAVGAYVLDQPRRHPEDAIVATPATVPRRDA